MGYFSGTKQRVHLDIAPTAAPLQPPISERILLWGEHPTLQLGASMLKTTKG